MATRNASINADFNSIESQSQDLSSGLGALSLGVEEQKTAALVKQSQETAEKRTTTKEVRLHKLIYIELS